MYRPSSLLLGALFAAQLNAAPLFHPPGTSLTYGDVSNNQSTRSVLSNPAAGAAARKHNGEAYTIGFTGSVGAGAEYGEVDNMFETLDEQAAAFDEGLEAADTSEVDAAVNALNATLADIDEHGYGKIFASASGGVPVHVTRGLLGGTLSFEAGRSLASKGTGLHDTIVFDAGTCVVPPGGTATCGDVTIDDGANTFTVDNDSTLLIRGADVLEYGFGFSLPVLTTDGGTLYAGARAKYYRVGLGRFNYRLGDVDDAEDLFDDIDEDDFEYSSDVGIDAGVLWVGPNYQLGATANNLNEPEFEYNGLDLGTYDSSSSVYDRLVGTDTYTMETQVKLEAALYTANRHWRLGASADANAVSDPFGDDYQWLAVNAAYATDSWLIPGVRLGYRANRAGEELRYVTFGSTLFKIINLDVAWGLDTVEIDGDELPRSVIANLGVDIAF